MPPSCVRPYQLPHFLLCIMTILPLSALAHEVAKPTAPTVSAPVAKKVPWKTTRHGETVTDDYRWLQQKRKPEVINYLKAENAYTEAMSAHFKPLHEKVYQEMKGRIQETDLSVPVRRGTWYYYTRVEAGKQYKIHCRRAANADLSDNPQAQEEILLDENVMAKGKRFFAIDDFMISPDQQWLAYTVDVTGYRQYQLFIKNLKTGQVQRDTLPRVTSVVWANDNQTLFAVQEDATTKRADRLLRLTPGKPAVEMLREKDVEFSISVEKTRDQQFVQLIAESTNTSEVSLLPASTPLASFKSVLGRTPNHRYVIEHRAGDLYITTNLKAKNFRLVRAPLATPDESHWKSLVEHDPQVLLEEIELFKDFMVVHEKTRAQNRQRIFDFAKESWKSITFDESVYLSQPAKNPEFDTQYWHMSFESPITPRMMLEINLQDGSRKVLKQQVVKGYDAARFESRRLWISARDGVQVPLWAVYKKGLRFDGSAPLLLYGYGSYGIPSQARFPETQLSLLERGVIFVVAQVRGGNEMGEPWHDDGMLMKKKNTFFDFIDSAQYLIDSNWTRADRLIIEGYSAGGLLVGAVSNMRPDLFHAVHAGVPFVDVMNTMMDASLPLTTGEYPEWGNPNQKPAHDYMRTYSPYDNIERKAYPAMLVTTGLNDSQVMYWEPAKYVAKLRAHKTDNNLLLLKTNMGAGHGGASGRYDALGERAFRTAWMLEQWKIKE